MIGKHNPGALRSTGRKLLTAWIGRVQRHAGLVLLLSAALTVAMLALSVTRLTINTNTDDMLSPELSFRQLDKEQREAFPQYADVLVVVVDGANSDATADAAMAVTQRLKARPDLFRTVFYAPAEPFFQQNGMLYTDGAALAEMADRIAAAQGLLAKLAADVSLRGFFDVMGLAVENLPPDGPEAKTLAAMMERMARVAVAQSHGQPDALAWRDVLRGEPASAGERRQLVLVQPALDYGSLQPAEQAIDEIRAIADDLGLAENGVRLRLTGSAALEQEELDSLQQNMGLINLASFLLVAALLFVALRSPRLGLATIVTMVMGLIWTTGFATIAIGHLNLISVAYAILFIGLSVDYGIHFGLCAMETTDNGGNPRRAVRRAGEQVGGALALSSLTAAIGFFAFVPTAYIGLAELGIIAAGGMAIDLIANLTVLPALLTVMPLPRREPRPSPLAALAEAGKHVVERHSGKVTLVAIGLGAAALLALPFARFDFDPMNLRDPQTESVRTLLDLMSDSHASPYAITILARNVDEARVIERRLERLPEVKGVITVEDLVPSDQDEKLDTISMLSAMLVPVLAPDALAPATPEARRHAWQDFHARLYRAAAANGPLGQPAARLAAALERLSGGRPPTDAMLAELERRLVGTLPGRLNELRRGMAAQAVALETLPADLGRRMLAPDGRVRVQVLPAGDMRDHAAMRRFIDAVRAEAPQATGAPVVIAEAGDAVVLAFWQASAIALSMILLLLGVILRSLRDTVLVLLPVTLATLLTIASSVLLNLPFNFANVLVLPLLFGMSVANGIHFVLRRREVGDAAQVMETSTPRAVVFSTTATIASFGTLAFSDHRGTASMGVMLTLAIVYTLVATLVVLPTFTNWLARRRAA